MMKKTPGNYTYASGGAGATAHLSGELLKHLTGVDMQHVPYKGNAPALNDLLGGHVTMMFDIASTALPQVKAGKLKGLAVTSAKRSPRCAGPADHDRSGLPRLRGQSPGTCCWRRRTCRRTCWHASIAKPTRRCRRAGVRKTLAEPRLRDRRRHAGAGRRLPARGDEEAGPRSSPQPASRRSDALNEDLRRPFALGHQARLSAAHRGGAGAAERQVWNSEPRYDTEEEMADYFRAAGRHR